MSSRFDLDLVEGAARRLLRFYALCGIAFAAHASGAATDDCRVPTSAPAVVVKQVIDGDTVRLADGRSLRLFGVNTPELGRRGGSAPLMA